MRWRLRGCNRRHEKNNGRGNLFGENENLNKVMKLFNLRTNILLFATLFAFGCFVVWCFSEQSSSQVFFVKASREFNSNFTDKEFNEFIKAGNTYPWMLAINRKVGFPYVRDDLYVYLDNKNRVTINNAEAGNTENLKPLKQLLEKVFRWRNENWVFEEGTNKIYKRVIFTTHLSAKYGDVVKIIDVLKSAGIELIILRIDDLRN